MSWAGLDRVLSGLGYIGIYLYRCIFCLFAVSLRVSVGVLDVDVDVDVMVEVKW